MKFEEALETYDNLINENVRIPTLYRTIIKYINDNNLIDTLATKICSEFVQKSGQGKNFELQINDFHYDPIDNNGNVIQRDRVINVNPNEDINMDDMIRLSTNIRNMAERDNTLTQDQRTRILNTFDERGNALARCIRLSIQKANTLIHKQNQN